MLEKRLHEVVTRIENAEQLDGPARTAQNLARRGLRNSKVDAVLRGEALGHPLHPALLVLPMGGWLSASVLDLTGGDAAAARRLVGFGCLAALPTAAAGAADWVRTTGAERRVGFLHAGINDLALGMYLLSWRSRARGRRTSGALLALTGGGLLGVGGWLGGHLAYRRGVGVDVPSSPV
jgi:uncharacterized membrane protein